MTGAQIIAWVMDMMFAGFVTGLVWSIFFHWVRPN